jgi:LysR family transcriptional regulator, glycine cleavage system transcriptional activator
MMRIPLQFLPAFKAAAELENLRAAAALLHLTPSAISQQINKLEEQLGFAVFTRQGRRVLLNDAGKLLAGSVEAALKEIEQGVQAAAAIANAQARTVVRITVVPSFAQRWLLPRLARWRSLHPDIRLQIETTRQTIDLQREGLHVGIRTGSGTWAGLSADTLCDLDLPLCALACPEAAQRVAGNLPAAISSESLLGDPELWASWFQLAGIASEAQPAATFADSGLMLQAAEQDIGLVLARGLYTVDALREGRLVQLSSTVLPISSPQRFFLVFPPSLQDWPPLTALRTWLLEEVRQSRLELAERGLLPP